MQTNNSDSHIGGFSYWHLGLVAGLAALLVLMIVMKSGFSFFGKKKTGDVAGVTSLTYEQVKKDVAENSVIIKDDESLTAEAIAMLDPSNPAGEVLGATTEELKNFPSIEEILTSEDLAKMQVRISKEKGKAGIEKYASDVTYVETKNNVLDLFASLNSDDPQVLYNSKKRTEDMVVSLGGINVPEELVDYHKYKAMYYMVLGKMATSLSGNQGKETLLSTTQILFALIEKIETIKVDVQNKYGVSL